MVTPTGRAQVDITTVEKTILESCKNRPKTGQEILAASGYSTRTGNFNRSLEKMLSLGLIEMTILRQAAKQQAKIPVDRKGAGGGEG